MEKEVFQALNYMGSWGALFLLFWGMVSMSSAKSGVLWTQKVFKLLSLGVLIAHLKYQYFRFFGINRYRMAMHDCSVSLVKEGRCVRGMIVGEGVNEYEQKSLIVQFIGPDGFRAEAPYHLRSFIESAPKKGEEFLMSYQLDSTGGIESVFPIFQQSSLGLMDMTWIITGFLFLFSLWVIHKSQSRTSLHKQLEITEIEASAPSFQNPALE